MPTTDPAVDPAGTDDPPEDPIDDGGDDDEQLDPVARPPWSKVIISAIALCWLAGTFGWFLASRNDEPSAHSVDAGFYLDMIPHHEQAVQMALTELQRGTDKIVLSYAQEIVVFQQYEIGLMEQKLGDWGIALTDRPEVAMAWMGMHVAQDKMPGLATPQQITALENASGTAEDEMFMDLMTAHHLGGIHMASYAAHFAKDKSVLRLSKRMWKNQSIEINEFVQTAKQDGLTIDFGTVPVPDV